jgi:cellobiose phosphorylase
VELHAVAAAYVLAAHRPGGKWYTVRAAGWSTITLRRLEVDQLRFTPCLPADWKAFKVHYRYRETVYHIAVLQTRAGNGEPRVTIDGVERPDDMIPLVDDRQEHSVEVRMAAPYSEGSS